MEIKVKAGSSCEKVVEDGSSLIVYVKSRAIEGKANRDVLRVLKKYFGKPVRIIRGLKSKVKIIKV